MAWYHIPGNEQDVVVSSRVRFARNLSGIPFASRMDATSANQVISVVGDILSHGGFTATDFADITPTAAYAMVEQHYASPAFVKVSLPHVLYVNQPCNLSVMLCEEDHIRLQCIQSGLALRVAYEGASKIEQMLDERLTFAFDEKLGYLTHCPTNLGSGMRASAMMFLPMLGETGRMDAMIAGLEALGVSVRGAFGEGTAASGHLYQLSNRITLGADEEETIEGLERVVSQVMKSERDLRGAVSGKAYDRLCDQIMRSLGALRYARMLSAGEMLSLLSYVRLGVAMGILDDVKIPTLTTLLIEGMPAMLAQSCQTPPESDHARDLLRASMVREKLKVGA